MIFDIENIIGNGHGYEAGGDVYFDISTFPAYGGLSGRDQVRTPSPSLPCRFPVSGG